MPTTLDSRRLSLSVLAAPLALCRLAPSVGIPAWTASAREFLSVTRTRDELSIVADQAAVPGDVEAHRGYRALRVDGPLDLGLVGVLASLAVPLAAAGVPILPIATHDTDYLLVPQSLLHRAIAALTDAGHVVRDPTLTES